MLNGITVIDVEHGRRLYDQRVVVVGTRVKALGRPSTVPIPLGARRVDGRGKYLIPGLWDMHTHPTAFAPTPEATWHMVNAAYWQLVANGITGIRDPGSAVSLETFRVWKREIAAGRRVGPRLIVSGPSIEQADERCSRDRHLPPCDSIHVYISRREDAPHLVDSLKTAGADMIKIHNVSRPIWFALAAAARRAGIPFGGHFSRDYRGDSLPHTVDGLVASDSGAVILDHGPWADICGLEDDTLASLTKCAAATARLRRNRTWIAASAGGARASDSLMRTAERYGGPAGPLWQWTPLSAAERRHLPTAADFAAALSDSVFHGPGCRRARLAYAADFPWVPGPDFPLGGLLSAHQFLLGPVLCGVPAWWTLRAATLEPVRALGLTDSLGTVAMGKVADLVLLDSDPLEDIWSVTKIAAVVANGRYFDRAALDRLLVEAGAEWQRAVASSQSGAEPKP